MRRIKLGKFRMDIFNPPDGNVWGIIKEPGFFFIYLGKITISFFKIWEYKEENKMNKWQKAELIWWIIFWLGILILILVGGK